MKEIVLTAEAREGVGKGVARKLRQIGMIPGVLYGPETKPLPLALKKSDLSGLIRHEGRTNMLIDLNVGADKNARKVIIRSLHRDPVTGEYEHVDLYQVSMKKKLHMSIHVHLTGIAAGVKNSGGILEHVTREIGIACLPLDIPERIEIDVTNLEIGDSVHVRNIKLEKVDILTDIDQTIATVVPPTVIKTEAAPTTAEAATAEAAPAEGEAKPAAGETAKKPGDVAKKPEEAAKGVAKPGAKPGATKPGKEEKK
jgi:large subunit ribosomal protein L25